MGFALELKRMTPEEFLSWENAQPTKHEFVRGEVFAMAGASERHITVVGNLYIALRNHLRGTPCRPLPSEMRLRIEAADCFYYPDLMVTCGEVTAEHHSQKTDALLVIEVLSPSTAAFDRGDKFADYRMLPSLAEYLLVDPDKRRCDLYRKRDADGLWVLHPSGPAEALQLESVALAVQADMLWEGLGVEGEPEGEGK